jgi:hypothetical protein
MPAPEKTTCPFCKQRISILFEQYESTGEPTGNRFLAYHPMKISEKYGVECPLSGLKVWENE